jgi:hypothetical protein
LHGHDKQTLIAFLNIRKLRSRPAPRVTGQLEAPMLIAITRVVLVLGAAAVAGAFAVSTGGYWPALLDPGSLLWFAWCLVPLGLVGGFGRGGDPPAAAWLLLVLAVLVSAGGAFVYLDAMVLHPDPQSAIAFAVVPFFQLALVLPGLGVAWALRRRRSPPAG